jgi:MFS family permease
MNETHSVLMSSSIARTVPAHLITYGGFLLLGGLAGDLLGRRLLIAGTALFAASSLACGLAGS